MSRLSYFIKEPIKEKDLATFNFRMSQMLSIRTRGYYDIFLLKIFQLFKSKVEFKNQSFLADKEEIKNISNILEKDGFTVLSNSLTEDELIELKDFLFKTKCYSYVNVGAKESFLIKDPSCVPENIERFYWSMEDLRNSKVIQNIIKDTTFHSIAQEYFGTKPTLVNMTAWLDTSYKNKDFPPHLMHYDNNGPKWLNFFIYLNDVNIDNGAHAFVKGTHNHHKESSELQKAKRFSDEEMKKIFGDDRFVTHEAPAGTIIAEDTMGFHRGGDINKGYRLLLKLQYSIIDIKQSEEDEKALKRDQVKIEGLDVGTQEIVSKLFK